MSKRDFDEYYNKVSAQLHSLQQVFDDLEEEITKGMVEPERKEQLQKTIEPIKNNFQTLSYVMYLLNKPAKKGKASAYKRMNHKLLKASEGRHQSDILSENQAILDKLIK